MRHVIAFAAEEIRAVSRRPTRLVRILSPRRAAAYFAYLRGQVRRLKLEARWRREEAPWEGLENRSTFRRRTYASYEDYVAHQRDKIESLGTDWLATHDVRYRNLLRARLKSLPLIRPGNRVLCLGARLGTEVKAFIDLGCFAIGIDLNPGPDNRYVVVGDFHNLQFADSSIDVIFTNSLDHVYDLGRLVQEAHRVLLPGGVVVVEMIKGAEEGGKPSVYESLHWSQTEDVIDVFTNVGFEVVHRVGVQYPRPGVLLCMTRGQSRTT